MWSNNSNCYNSSPPSNHSSDSFHVLHKVPVGDTPYVKAKHVQLVEKDPDRAIALFWAAINAGDRVDSALKDMAIVMKQQNRAEEAIEAIKSLRYRCTDQAQEALDNVLLDLYKRCGRVDDQISLLKRKLHLIHQGLAFNGKRTKTARSQGKKFQVSIEQEASRLLGNLGWAFMQQSNYVAAEAVYSKALSIEPDSNKVCNLGICLMKLGRLQEAKATLESVTHSENTRTPWTPTNSHHKSLERAREMLREIGAMKCVQKPDVSLQASVAKSGSSWDPLSSPARTSLKHHLPEILLATSGFGPGQYISNQLLYDDAEEGEYSPEEEAVQCTKVTGVTRKREESYWSLPGFDFSEDCRLPLTSDFTNKAYGRSTDRGESKWGKPKDIPSARRSLFSDVVNNAIRDNESRPAEEEGRQVYDEDNDRCQQRRLKVFEDMTLPGSLLV